MPKLIISPAALDYIRGRQAVIYEARYRGCCGGQVFDYEITMLDGEPPTDNIAARKDDALIWYPAGLPECLEIQVDLVKLLWLKKLTITIPKMEGEQCKLP